MQRQYFALIAQIGAGKGLLVKTVQKLYPELAIISLRYSDPLREMLRDLKKEQSRENLQILGESLRQAARGEGILSKILISRVETMPADIVFFDGIRKEGEARAIQEIGAKLIYIFADQKTRYQRRLADPDNPGEREMTFEEFQRRDSDPAEMDIRRIGETMADIKIENNGTIEEFQEKIKEICKKIIPR